MLKGNNVVTFKDQKRKNNVECEINLPGEHQNTLRLTIGGKDSYIKIKDFYAVCLLLVKGKLLDNIIPNVERQVKKYKRQIKLIANKDIKQGEEIIVTYEVDLDAIVADNIKENVNTKNGTENSQ